MPIIPTMLPNETEYNIRYSADVNLTFNYVPVFNMPPKALIQMIEFQRWCIPVVVAFGLPLNLIGFYIFWRTKLRKASSSRYMAAIAIADCGCLITSMLTHLTQLDVPLYWIHGSCQITMYISHISTFLSIWYMTALVLEKFIGLFWPRKKSRFCTVFRAKCVIISLAIMSIVCYHYITWTVGPSDDLKYCWPWPDKELLEPYVKIGRLDAILTAAIPHVMILVLSCLILIRTWQYYRISQSPEHQQFVRRQRTCVPQEKEFKTTPALLCVAFVTVFLDIPNCLVRNLEMESVLFGLIGYFLQLNSYSVKTILYVISSSQFRDELWRVMQTCYQRCRMIGQDSTEMQSVSQQTDGGALRIIQEGKV